MVNGGMSKSEVARREGVSRAAVTMGLKKLASRSGKALSENAFAG